MPPSTSNNNEEPFEPFAPLEPIFDEVTDGPPTIDQTLLDRIRQLNELNEAAELQGAPRPVPQEEINHVERELIMRSRGTRNTASSQMWQYQMSMKGVPEKDVPPQKLTPALDKKLQIRAQQIENERNDRRNKAWPKQTGRREGEYLNLHRQNRTESMTASEIANSENPVPLHEISSSKFMEMVHGLNVAGITGDGRNTRIQFTCTQCHLEDVPQPYAYLCNGSVLCSLCVPDLSVCNVCNHLRSNCKKINAFDGRKIMACEKCLRIRTNCQACDNKLKQEYIEVRLCGNCVDKTNHSFPRKFSLGAKWIGTERGITVKSNRVFSCEVEALSPIENWAAKLFTTLPKEVGIDRDGSINNNGERVWPFELQTPKLSGARGEELIRQMSASLKLVKASVNESCGMHIHLDGTGIIGTDRKAYPQALLQLWRTYVVFEDVIMSFLPFSRRRNDYCRPLAEAFKMGDLETIESIADVEKLWYQERTYSNVYQAKGHKYHASRYFGANFHSLFAHGHFEVRFHSGTTNTRKILEWANLHALILDACEAGVMDHDLLREAQATYLISEKTKLLFERIDLAQNSRQYFRSRQNKFGNKKTEDEEVRKSKVVPPRIDEITRVLAEQGGAVVDGSGRIMTFNPDQGL